MKQPPRTSKYGKDSPCDGCAHIGLPSGDLPCRECMMVLKPSNYVNKESQKLESINQNMAECNQFRAKQIEKLEDEISNLKGQLKFADSNILNLAGELKGLSTVHNKAKTKIAEVNKIIEANRTFLIERTQFYQEMKQILCVEKSKGDE